MIIKVVAAYDKDDKVTRRFLFTEPKYSSDKQDVKKLRTYICALCPYNKKCEWIADPTCSRSQYSSFKDFCENHDDDQLLLMHPDEGAIEKAFGLKTIRELFERNYDEECWD